jgi:hypothetical protein
LVKRNSQRHRYRCGSERSSDRDFKGPSRSSASERGCFRRPVARSGGAVLRPGTPPRLTRFPAAEWVVVRASPCPRRDAFWIGDSSRNTKRGFDVASFHATRSHDRGTRAEWYQSRAPRRLAAKATARNLATAARVRGCVAKAAGIWGNFGLCWCGWQTVGSAPDKNRFTVSRTGETDVLWCRFRDQKGNSDSRRYGKTGGRQECQG